MPKATKLTETQIRILRNIHEGLDDRLSGFYGLQARGGATTSLTSLIRRGLIDGRTLKMTDAGKRALEELEPNPADAADTTNAVRRVLSEAGHTEARGRGVTWGYQAKPGSVPGGVRLTFVRSPDYTKPEGSKRFGNDRISEYVRALQTAGFRVSRVNGVKEVDSLLVFATLRSR